MLPRAVVTALRALLIVTFAAVLVAEVRAVPASYDDWLRGAPATSAARWPLLAAALLVLLCVQAVIVCVWHLLTRVDQDRILSEESFRWVDATVGSVAVAAAVLAGAFGYSVGPLGLPAAPSVAMFLALVTAAVLGLLMVVMRALLRQATALRVDMDAVI
jgi:hypothetical protein